MRPFRSPGSGRPGRQNSARFAKTFARRPLLPRVAPMPDRRAWTTTAFVAAFVAGAAVAVPLITHLGGGSKSDTVVAVDAPLVLKTPTGTPTKVPTATTTATATTTSTATVTSAPRVSVATATVTMTAPGGKVTVVQPGTTVTLPPVTVTAPPAALKPATVTATTTSTATTTVKVTEPGKQGMAAEGQALQPRKDTPTTLQSEGSKRCVDVKDGRAGSGNDGTPLQVWDCTKGAGQTWTFNPDGTVRSLGQCMDLAWGSIAENTPVQLVACNGNAAQQFRITQKNELINPAAEGKCITADKGDNGGRLFLRHCTGAADQHWRQP
ncbi:RICIN domain-containing protein [Kribbella ginsengisoli]|uniref:Ricin B lectin domain-containing protein n=1 Tax=Kribbella ginsengisoli TaxID=363865 RepID=A0ABP6Y2V2_9ACTN